MPKPISHVVRRPGPRPGDPDVEIPVAEDLVTVPGHPVREADISFYSREYPLEQWHMEKGADRDWAWTVYSDEFSDFRKEHENTVKPLVAESRKTAELEPTRVPDASIDVTETIRSKARELGFGEVGFTRYDRRYTYKSKKGWVKFGSAICLAWEQDYDATQSTISMAAEHAHYGAYEVMGEAGLRLGDFIRTLGYRAQVHNPNDASAPTIPYFVNAGLGQLGANGQLLMPHFGSRARLMMMTTDAPVRYDEPVDYGINKFCDECQVCVQRCPARALVREKIWWRGALKNKVIYDRCRPLMVKLDGCGVCMKVCPVQKYGMKPVMEHYVETGEVLGKGTDDLEGFPVPDGRYFGSGELPQFDREFFDFPQGTREQWLFEQLKQRMDDGEEVTEEELAEFADQVKEAVGQTKKGWGSTTDD